MALHVLLVKLHHRNTTIESGYIHSMGVGRGDVAPAGFSYMVHIIHGT